MRITVRIQDVLIVDAECGSTSTYLLFVNGDGEYLFIREGHFGQYNHVSPIPFELLFRVEVQCRFQFLVRFLSVSLMRISSMSKRMFVRFDNEKSMKK